MFSMEDIIEKLDNNESLDVETCRQLLWYGMYDSISGLKNRHALELKVKEIESDKHPWSIGVMFADINALKFVNDKYGHDMGDELIRKCAFLLVSHFGKECCYRIGGDEFIVLMDRDISEGFMDEIRIFQKNLREKDIPPMSIGYYYENKCSDVSQAICIAEENMRDDKELFYRDYPEFRR